MSSQKRWVSDELINTSFLSVLEKLTDFFYLFTFNKSSYISWLDHSKSAPGCMGHEGTDKSPVPLYDFWNTYNNNSCPDKYNLGKDKHFLVGSVFVQLNITNKPNYFLTFFILKRERTSSLRFSRGPLGNIRLSLRARRFHLGLDLGKAKLSKMSRGLNTWLNRITGHWEQFLAVYLAKVTIKCFQSEGDSIVI